MGVVTVSDWAPSPARHFLVGLIGFGILGEDRFQGRSFVPRGRLDASVLWFFASGSLARASMMAFYV